tara:strand:+ start:150 stop:326 length:177 start_codon:yes stop_codon:yes gene_type:complete
MIDKTYKIIRFYRDENHPENRKVILTGLTEEEAQEHCQREDTREKGVWFDGYTDEAVK